MSIPNDLAIRVAGKDIYVISGQGNVQQGREVCSEVVHNSQDVLDTAKMPATMEHSPQVLQFYTPNFVLLT